jgi:hypothetical protein
VCRVSETEAWAVGTGGALFSIAATSATREASVTVTTDLLAIDCPAAGQVVACGAGSTVLLRRANGAFTPTPAVPGPNRALNSCKLVGGTVWVAGDGFFGRLDPSASTWTTLPSRAGLNHLLVRAPNDVWATAASSGATFDVVRFDGTAWSTVLSGVSGAPGGGVQIGARVVWGASGGVLVEGR